MAKEDTVARAVSDSEVASSTAPAQTVGGATGATSGSAGDASGAMQSITETVDVGSAESQRSGNATLSAMERLNAKGGFDAWSALQFMVASNAAQSMQRVDQLGAQILANSIHMNNLINTAALDHHEDAHARMHGNPVG